MNSLSASESIKQTIRVNFHCHSSLSDGSLSPEQLATELAASGVRFAALTDHDSIDGLSAFDQVLDSHGIGLLTGVEITVEEAPDSLHILAYGFDPENRELQQLIRRQKSNHPGSVLKDVRRLGAQLKSRFPSGKKDSDEIVMIGVSAIIQTIHRAGGTAFLAHPLAASADMDQLNTLLEELKALSLDGIEAFYAGYTESVQEQLVAAALHHDLLVCAGTDFHGFDQAGLNQIAHEMPLDYWMRFRKAHRLPIREESGTHARSADAIPSSAPLRKRLIRPRNPSLQWRRFILRIVFPTLLAFGLSMATIFGLILPSLKNNLMDRKREMIRELVYSASSTLTHYEGEVREGRISRAEAMKRATSYIEYLRYGLERKDYFWVTDMQPRMIMHPYRMDLNGSDLSDFKDVRGSRLFVEFVKVAREKKEGFVEYYWQWKDNPERVAPKQSFVKLFEPWGWVIGTGIYLEDVNQEIDNITGWLVRLCLAISVVIILLLAYITRESLAIEKRRSKSEAELQDSHEKYAALVEATTEGTLMVLDGRCAYSNNTMAESLGYSEEELSQLDFRDLFPQETETGNSALSIVEATLEGKRVPDQFEANLLKKNREWFRALCSITRIALGGKTGFILVARDISHRLVPEEERDALLGELQSELLFMNEPINGFAQNLPLCALDTSIRNAVGIMSHNASGIMGVTAADSPAVMGIVTDWDLRERVLSSNLDMSRPVHEIMSSPVISLPDSAAVFEAILKMEQSRVHHLVLRDSDGQVRSLVSNSDLLRLHRYTSAVITGEIQKARTISEIVDAKMRLPWLIKTLLHCGARPRTINRIMTRISDTIVERLIGIAIGEIGVPPTSLCFMALGSEGRGEQTLVTDQDNAVIYGLADDGDSDACRSYCLRLGTMVSAGLSQAGYAFCPGEIMARNPKWNRPLQEWKINFRDWIMQANPQDLLEFNTFFDFRCIFGEWDLARELRGFIHALIKEHPPFLLHLAQNALLYKPPIGLFGKIVGESGGESANALNLKEVMLPIVNFARLYSLRHAVNETNTLDRLHKLLDLQVIKKAFHEEILHAYSFLMEIRLRNQIAVLADNRRPDNMLDLKSVTSLEEALLKESFSIISTIRKKISFDFLGQA